MNAYIRYASMSVLTALTCACSAFNPRPDDIETAANTARTKLADIKANAAERQKELDSRMEDLMQSEASDQKQAQEYEHDANIASKVWRIRDDKAKLRFINELKADDERLTSNPYALLRQPLPTDTMFVIDTSGLDSAIKGVSRIIYEDSFSSEERLEFVKDVLQNVDTSDK